MRDAIGRANHSYKNASPVATGLAFFLEVRDRSCKSNDPKKCNTSRQHLHFLGNLSLVFDSQMVRVRDNDVTHQVCNISSNSHVSHDVTHVTSPFRHMLHTKLCKVVGTFS